MTAAIDIIQSAGEEISAFAPGEPIQNADAQRCLTVLNDILDSWSNQNLACFTFLSQTFTLVQGKVRYSIGPGADIDGTRPLKIIQWYLTDTQGNNYGASSPLELFEWNQLIRNHVDGDIPTFLYYDPQEPWGFINIWPTPIIPLGTVTISTYQQLASFPDLVTPVVLPRGYIPALKANLAVAICPFFGKMPSIVTAELASRYLADIKRTNRREIYASFDPAITARGGWAYDIRTDGYGN